MWSTTFNLVVGHYRVGIRADSDETRRRLLALLGAYVDSSDPVPLRSNFSLRAPHGVLRRRHGELYIAGRVGARSARFDTLAHALVGHLSGVARSGSAPSVVRGARVFAVDDRAVLVRLRRPCRTDPPEQIRHELPVWDPFVDAAAGDIVVPAPLDVRWAEAHVAAPAEAPFARLRLVGVVAPADGNGAADIAPFWLDSEGELDAWAARLTTLQLDRRVMAATSLAEVAAAVELLLGSSGG